MGYDYSGLFRNSFHGAHNFISGEDRVHVPALTQFLHDLYRPELNQKEDGSSRKEYAFRIPVFMKGYEDDLYAVFASTKLFPKRKSSTTAAEGLLGLNGHFLSSYINQGQYAYSRSGKCDGRTLARCYSIAIDIDCEARMYLLPDEERLPYIREAYPELFGKLAPTYIVATGKKGIQLIYCFLEDVSMGYKQESYSRLQDLLIDYFDADPARKGVGMIRLPFSSRCATPSDLAAGVHVESPYILWRKETGPVHYSAFCRDVSSFFMNEGYLNAPIPPYASYEQMKREKRERLRKNRHHKKKRCPDSPQTKAIRLHNSRRLYDMEKLVSMRNGEMTGMRDNALYIYAAAAASVKSEPDDIRDAVMAFNDRFSEPLTEREAESVVRTVINQKERDHHAKNISDGRAADILCISASEMKHLKNCYTPEQKKDRRRKNAQERNKNGNHVRGRRSNLGLYIGTVAEARRKAEDNSAAVKQAVARGGVPRSRAYAIIKLLERLHEKTAGMKDVICRDDTGEPDISLYNSMVCGMLHAVKGLSCRQRTAAGDILWHMLCGDFLRWHESDDGNRTWRAFTELREEVPGDIICSVYPGQAGKAWADILADSTGFDSLGLRMWLYKKDAVSQPLPDTLPTEDMGDAELPFSCDDDKKVPEQEPDESYAEFLDRVFIGYPCHTSSAEDDEPAAAETAGMELPF